MEWYTSDTRSLQWNNHRFPWAFAFDGLKRARQLVCVTRWRIGCGFLAEGTISTSLWATAAAEM